jgi:branched-subunit amino acid aminotransferase/4-amino-4-deoxychorismate lyase
MPVTIAWINGRWGDPDDLQLPLSDRGLQLADGLFETILILNGAAQLLPEHLARWVASAELLGMDPPPSQQDLSGLIDEAIVKSELGQASGALRLNWSRGSGQGRGIGIANLNQHRFWLTLTPSSTHFRPIRTITSRLERRNRDSVSSRCKTFAYTASIQARCEAERAGADDALLHNTQGELCCGTVANLLVHREGRWITPPLSSGCLPGVMRARAISLGIAMEADVGETLQSSDQGLLINSLSCRPIEMHDNQSLTAPSCAQELWQLLLDKGGSNR